MSANRLSPLDLDELSACEAKATTGPWAVQYYPSFGEIGIIRVSDQKPICDAYAGFLDEDDAEFVVAACNMTPALIAEIVDLRAALKSAREEKQ